MTRIQPELPQSFVMYELLRTYGFHGEVIERMTRALDRGRYSGKRFYSKDHIAYLDRDQILIEPICSGDDCRIEASEKSRFRYVGGSLIAFEHKDVDHVETFNLPRNIALLDEDKLTYPLAFRRWKEGDSFVPFGMEGSKKVSDFLIDEKVSMPDKQRQFVLLSGDEVVWVVGRRIDDRYRITKQTERVLVLIQEVVLA